MSWLTILSETYDTLMKAPYANRRSLLPLAHSTQKAHITIVIDQDGDFVRGEFVTDVEAKEKNLSQTLIPVTEKSASRSNGIAPHPLCDKLKYIAADYDEYTSEKGSSLAYYESYMAQLLEWRNFAPSNVKLNAIITYSQKKSVISDLIANNILSISDKGILTDKWELATTKLTTGNQVDAFLRFSVIGVNDVPQIWQDGDLQDSFVQYYLSKQEDLNFCYVTGNVESCSINHPSKIRHSGDKAKLISANDTSGFTYRGRFQSPTEAVQIGYLTSQKAHNALKYLLEKQGSRVGEKVFLLWGTQNESVPDLFEDTFDFLFKDEDTSEYSDTLESYAVQFTKIMNGYKEQVSPHTNFALLGLDAATTGRMALIYYREYLGHDVITFLNQVAHWHTTANWFHTFKFQNKKPVCFWGAPAPYEIAKCAFGTEQGDFIGGNEKVFAKTVERLLPCISDGAKIPRDIAFLLVRKCYSPQNYSKSYNWQKVLSITCSVYKKYLFDYTGEVIDMKIDEQYTDLSYLCGRLLAIADEIERYALREQYGKDGNRTTNAMRYFNRYTKFPNDTWRIINDRLTPYMMKLGNKGRHLYALKEEISSKIDPKAFADAKNLDGKMALGFDSQKKALYDRMVELSINKEDK